MADGSDRLWLKLGVLLIAAALTAEGLELDAEAGSDDRGLAEQALPRRLSGSSQLSWLAGGVVSAVGFALAYRRWDVMPENVKAFLACCVFMFVGPVLIMLNKHIMQECDFPYPLSLSSVGLLASSSLAQVLTRFKISDLRPETIERMSGSNFYRIVGPLATTKAFALAAGNAVFLYLSLGFISMLKSFTPAIVLVVMIVSQVTLPVRPARWMVVVIVFGTAITVQGELSYTVFGFLLMMGSCIAEAISMVLNQKLLQNWSFSEVETMYYVAGPSLLVLTLPAIFLEWGPIVRNERYLIFVEYPMQMCAAAVLGTGVNFITLGVIRLTSSMAVKVLNTFRCILLVAIGMVFYGETHSARQLWGYFISVVGFVGYNYFQVKKDKAKEVEEWVDSCFYPPIGANGATIKDEANDGGDSEDALVENGERSPRENGVEIPEKDSSEVTEGTEIKPQAVGKFLES